MQPVVAARHEHPPELVHRVLIASVPAGLPPVPTPCVASGLLGLPRFDHVAGGRSVPYRPR
eukprot:1952075-Prymnesium_polylepis.1